MDLTLYCDSKCADSGEIGTGVCPTTKTMCVGEPDYLSAMVCPYNATNQSVVWCSSDDSVATVGTYTGFVRVKKAGAVTITATTVDGGYKGCCNTMIDGREKVTISKDGLFFIFNLQTDCSGKI